MSFDRVKKWYVLVVALIFIISLLSIYSLLSVEYGEQPSKSEMRSPGIRKECRIGNIEFIDAIYIDGYIYLSVYNHDSYDLTRFGVVVTYNDSESSTSFWTIDETLHNKTLQTFSHNLSNPNIAYIEIRSEQCQGIYDKIGMEDITVR